MKDYKELFEKARKYQVESKVDEALKIYKEIEKSAQTANDKATALQHIGVCMYMLNKTEEAEKSFADAERTIGNEDAITLSNIYRDWAGSIKSKDELNGALEKIEKAISVLDSETKKNGQDFQILAVQGINLTFKADVLSELKKYDEALKLFEEADNVLAKSGHLYYRMLGLGRQLKLLVDIGRDDEARKLINNIHFFMKISDEAEELLEDSRFMVLILTSEIKVHPENVDLIKSNFDEIIELLKEMDKASAKLVVEKRNLVELSEKYSPHFAERLKSFLV